MTAETKIWDGKDARDLLDLVQDGEKQFVARCTQANFGGSVYGGVMLAQGLCAAARVAPDEQRAYSVTAHFLAAGTIGQPLRYAVDPLREGGATTTLQVTVWQDVRRLAVLTCGFGRSYPGVGHQIDPPDLDVDAEGHRDIIDYVREHAPRLPAHAMSVYGAERPIVRRLADPESFFFRTAARPAQTIWLALPAASAVDDDRQRLSLAAYLSDASMLSTSMVMHRVVGAASDLLLQTVSHSVCLHAIPRITGWMLYVLESPWAGDGRGCSRGLLYDDRGTLIASSLQLGMVRTRQP